jgi:hypothetical protein
MTKGHLITCLDKTEVKTFDESGYVGTGPFYPGSDATAKQLGGRLRILWDVIADLKRARPGDVCFLHSEGQIFGPYVLTSSFKESASMPPILRSSNITHEYWVTNKSLFDDINMDEYGYVASIEKPRGCNDKGTHLMELFLNQAKGIFNGVPPRFMYGDIKKVVKPLLYHEIVQLLDIVQFNGDWSPSQASPFQTAHLSDITLDLSDYGGHLYCEKLLEAWFMENMYPDSAQHELIESMIGKYDYYSNSTYTYYTNFLDVLAYDLDSNYVLSHCDHCNSVNRDFAQEIRIIELKRDYIGDPAWVVDQVEAYVRWAQAVLNPRATIRGYIVAAGFGEGYQEMKASKPHIAFIQYKITTNGLNLERV